MNMRSILVVDDEEKIREVITSYLKKEGYSVHEAANGKQAIDTVRHQPLDLVVLDLMLPDISGEDVCKQIRQNSPVPILMLTAKVAEENRVRGLSIGADDYVVKPFSPKELVARVKAIIRRSSDNDLLADRVEFNQGELIVDSIRHEVFKDGKQVNLTPNEYKILVLLARHPKRAFSRDELVEKLNGHNHMDDVRTIDQHVKNLRQKIEDDSKNPKYIATVYGVGYKFTGSASK